MNWSIELLTSKFFNSCYRNAVIDSEVLMTCNVPLLWTVIAIWKCSSWLCEPRQVSGIHEGDSQPSFRWFLPWSTIYRRGKWEVDTVRPSRPIRKSAGERETATLRGNGIFFLRRGKFRPRAFHCDGDVGLILLHVTGAAAKADRRGERTESDLRDKFEINRCSFTSLLRGFVRPRDDGCYRPFISLGICWLYLNWFSSFRFRPRTWKRSK